MIPFAFLLGLIVSGSLAWQGLVRQQMQFSTRTTLAGRTAQMIGAACLLFALACVGGIVWIVASTGRH